MKGGEKKWSIPYSIAHFHESYGIGANGISTVLSGLTNAQARQGLFPFVISSGKENGRWNQGAVQVNSFKGFPVGIIYPDYVVGRISLNKILSICREKKTRLVHIHMESSNGLNGLYVQKILKVPCVTSFHTFWTHYSTYIMGSGPLTGPIRAFAWAFLRYFHAHSDAVIAPSKFVKQELEKRGFERVHVVPNGVDISLLKPVSERTKQSFRKKYGIPKGKRVVACLGRLGKEKNLPFLVSILENEKDAVLLIGGKGPARPEIERAAKIAGVSGRVFFTGFVPDSDLCGFYGCGDVFAMPSRTETQGLVALEAMACARPVVVFKGATSEIVRNGKDGLVANTPSEFREAVGRIFSSGRLAKRMGLCARKTAENNSFERMATNVSKVYRKAETEFRKTQVGKRDIVASMVRTLKGYGGLKRYFEMEWDSLKP